MSEQDNELQALLQAEPVPTRRATVPALEEELFKMNRVLDHGFVRVVDYMGDDGAIVQAARVSYGKGTRKASNDRGLIRYLMRHRHCYDEQTEVLTDHGFRPWREVRDTMRLGIWDDAAGSLTYERPRYVTAHHYDGPMYKVAHGGVDLMVTPDHKMWVAKKRWDKATKRQPYGSYGLVPASELGDASCVRYNKLAPFKAAKWDGAGFPKHADTSALLEFLGFFVGDGSASGSRVNGVEFHLRKECEIGFLGSVVRRMGWKMKATESYGGRQRFVVYGDGIGRLFRQQFYAGKEKNLPDWMLMLGREDAAAVLRGLRASDGTTKRGAWELSTRYDTLADQVQRLALHAGEAAHINKRNNGMNGVMMLSRMQQPVVNQGSRQTSMVPYRGMVYCANTRTGVLVVRRNGKIVLSGNTTPFEMCEIKLHVKLPIFVARQWIRHRTANVNEYSARYSILDNEFYVPDPAHLAEQSTDNKQGRKEAAITAEQSAAVLELLKADGSRTYETYTKLINDQGDGTPITEGDPQIARELARINLGVNYYTQWYWKTDLHNLFHFLSLRMHPHAQYEIRVYAEIIGDIVKKWVPDAYGAFEDYRLNGGFFSGKEMEILRAIINEGGDPDELLPASGMSFRERKGFRDKLNIPPPRKK